MKAKNKSRYLLVTFLYFCCAFVLAKDTASPTHIKIVTEHLPPFQIVTNKKVSGFATEIINKAMQKTPYSYDVRAFPWSRSYNMALNVENTCIYSIARTPERENKFIWVNTIAKRDASFVGLAINNFDITSIEDVKKHRVAVIRDDVTHQYLLNEGFKEGKNLYVLNNTHSLLKLLTQRESIDLILVDANTINYRARINKIDPQLFKKYYQFNKEEVEYYFACQIDTSPVIINSLRNAISELKAKGELQEIVNKWQYPLLKVEE